MTHDLPEPGEALALADELVEAMGSDKPCQQTLRRAANALRGYADWQAKAGAAGSEGPPPAPATPGDELGFLAREAHMHDVAATVRREVDSLVAEGLLQLVDETDGPVGDPFGGSASFLETYEGGDRPGDARLNDGGQ